VGGGEAQVKGRWEVGGWGRGGVWGGGGEWGPIDFVLVGEGGG